MLVCVFLSWNSDIRWENDERASSARDRGGRKGIMFRIEAFGNFVRCCERFHRRLVTEPNSNETLRHLSSNTKHYTLVCLPLPFSHSNWNDQINYVNFYSLVCYSAAFLQQCVISGVYWMFSFFSLSTHVYFSFAKAHTTTTFSAKCITIFRNTKQEPQCKRF